MIKIEKRIYAQILKQAAKQYGVNPLHLTEKQHAGRSGMSYEIKQARGLYLLTVKQLGLKHNVACRLINMNQGNATMTRNRYEEQHGTEDADTIAKSITDA